MSDSDPRFPIYDSPCHPLFPYTSAEIRFLDRSDECDPISPICATHLSPVVFSSISAGLPLRAGKTLAFLLPLLAKSSRTTPAQIICVSPSRELALQLERAASSLWPAGDSPPTGGVRDPPPPPRDPPKSSLFRPAFSQGSRNSLGSLAGPLESHLESPWRP